MHVSCSEDSCVLPIPGSGGDWPSALHLFQPHPPRPVRGGFTSSFFLALLWACHLRATHVLEKDTL